MDSTSVRPRGPAITIQAVEGDFMVRVGMMNPDSLDMVMGRSQEGLGRNKVYNSCISPSRAAATDPGGDETRLRAEDL